MIIALFIGVHPVVGGAQAIAQHFDVLEVSQVTPVWAGHQVGFSLLTSPPYQFVAFYDAERSMVLASRHIDSDVWSFVRLPEKVIWDSHNYITMALDDHGYLHVSGNMHVDPLVYFVSEKPYDIGTMTRVGHLVGHDEDRVTYPRFFRGPNNEFVFRYRTGSSGDGSDIYNVYDADNRSWRRLLDQPLISGEGRMSAYPEGPVLGPDGYYHLAWIWRDTPDAATNHDISYARSKDLVHWEKSTGEPYELPITFDTAEIVDPVPPFGGAINGNVRIGFDSKQRAIITYHKFDENGVTQLYNARLESEGWQVYQVGTWNYRWEFGGGGSLPSFDVRVQPVQLENGRLVQSYRHVKYGNVSLVLDENSLQPIGVAPPPTRSMPPSLGRVRSSFPEMQVNWSGDLGESVPQNVVYRLRWETLGNNRDQPREGELPEPTMLEVVKLRIGD